MLLYQNIYSTKPVQALYRILCQILCLALYPAAYLALGLSKAFRGLQLQTLPALEA